MFKHEEIYGEDTRGADITQKERDSEGGSEEWREAEILNFFFFIGIVPLVLVQMHYFCNFTNRIGTNK